MKMTPDDMRRGGGVMLCRAPLYKGCATQHTYGAPYMLRKLGAEHNLRKLRNIPDGHNRFFKGVRR